MVYTSSVGIARLDTSVKKKDIHWITHYSLLLSQWLFVGSGIGLFSYAWVKNVHTWRSSTVTIVAVALIAHIVDVTWSIVGKFMKKGKVVPAKTASSKEYKTAWALVFMLMLLCWLRLYMITAEAQGWAGPRDKSSCQRNLLLAKYSAWNPNGYFPAGNFSTYNPRDEHGFCVLDLRWGDNNGEHIRGYEGAGGGGAEANPGHVGVKPSDYPNPAFGVLISNLNSPLPMNNSQDKVVFCPGSRGTPVSPPHIICPRCLGHWRYLSGNVLGPVGYEQCTKTQPRTDAWCEVMCPGRGFGILDRDHSVNHDDLLEEFWIVTSILCWVMLGWFWNRAFIKTFATIVPVALEVAEIPTTSDPLVVHAKLLLPPANSKEL